MMTVNAPRCISFGINTVFLFSRTQQEWLVWANSRVFQCIQYIPLITWCHIIIIAEAFESEIVPSHSFTISFRLVTAAGLGPLRGFQHFNCQQQGRWIEHDTASTWSVTLFQFKVYLFSLFFNLHVWHIFSCGCTAMLAQVRRSSAFREPSCGVGQMMTTSLSWLISGEYLLMSGQYHSFCRCFHQSILAIAALIVAFC